MLSYFCDDKPLAVIPNDGDYLDQPTENLLLHSLVLSRYLFK